MTRPTVVTNRHRRQDAVRALSREARKQKLAKRILLIFAYLLNPPNAPPPQHDEHAP